MESSGVDADELKERIVAAIKTCYDPEIPVDVYELGLIYDIELDADACAKVTMTLTTPMCPVAETLPPEVERKVAGVPGVAEARVVITWDPPWEPKMMSEAAKLDLGF
jgi:FeS assembly SUF system protein